MISVKEVDARYVANQRQPHINFQHVLHLSQTIAEPTCNILNTTYHWFHIIKESAKIANRARYREYGLDYTILCS